MKRLPEDRLRGILAEEEFKRRIKLLEIHAKISMIYIPLFVIGLAIIVGYFNL